MEKTLKSVILTIILFVSCSSDPRSLKKKKHVRAGKGSIVNGIQQSSDEKYERITFDWSDKDNKIISSECYQSGGIGSCLFFYKNGMPKHFFNSRLLQEGFDSHKGIPSGEKESVASGKEVFYYESGNLKSETCHVAIERVGSRKCGEEIHYKEDGSIEKKINHPQKCTQGCDLMIPYREEGKYIAMKDDIKVWDTSIMDKQYKYLKERTGEPKKVLKKGDVVTVVEDLQLTESGNTAPWVKVKLGLFSYGYVSSDHLDGPFE